MIHISIYHRPLMLSRPPIPAGFCASPHTRLLYSIANAGTRSGRYLRRGMWLDASPVMAMTATFVYGLSRSNL